MRILIAVSALLLAATAGADTVLINDVRIFNGVDAELSAGNVLVDDGRIAKISSTTIDAPEGATVIDGNGRVPPASRTVVKP
ncbi:MAG: hypothetical protein AAFN50_11845, partial [Pseudomonadota bacterium]